MKQTGQLRDDLRERWRGFLRAQALDRERQRGFIGWFPYLLALRLVFVAAIVQHYYLAPERSRSLADPAVGIPLALVIFVALLHAGRLYPTKVWPEWALIAMVVADIALVTYFYKLADNVRSDFSLLYVLPVLVAVEHLGGWQSLSLFALNSAAFGGVVFALPFDIGRLVMFLTREFFLAVTLVVSLFLVQLAETQSRKIRTLLEALSGINAAAVQAMQLDRRLDEIFDEIKNLGFDLAAISLADEYRRKLDMIKGWNIAPGWMRRSKRDMNEHDIIADVYRNGKAESPSSEDPRHDAETREFFKHWRLARAFVPIFDGQEKVGVLQAGWEKERKGEIPADLMDRLSETVRQKGRLMGQARPYLLLEEIAQLAASVLEADAACLFVYQDESVMLEAGWIDPEAAPHQVRSDPKGFVRAFGEAALSLSSRLKQAREPERLESLELKSSYPSLFESGIRAVAASSLQLGPETAAVLYVGFFRTSRISEGEVRLLEVFAGHTEFALGSYFRARESANRRAWAEHRRKAVEEALAEHAPIDRVLQAVADHLLYSFDADNVTLYQFFAESGRFDTPPVMAGHFEEPAAMGGRVSAVEVFQGLVSRESRFLSDVDLEKTLSGQRNDRGTRFAAREGIRSCAILVLKPTPAETVGLLFVNYRRPQRFSGEEWTSMLALASSAAVAIRSARVGQATERSLERRKKDLEAIHAIDRLIVGSIERRNLDSVLDAIVEHGKALTGAKAGSVLWRVGDQELLKMRVDKGFGFGPDYVQTFDEGIIGLAVRDKKSQLASDLSEEKWKRRYKETLKGVRSELVVPLVDGSRVLGVLNLEHFDRNAFSRDDQSVAEILAVQAVMTARGLELLERLEGIGKPLVALSSIANRIHKVYSDLDTVFRLVLTGVTAGEGLGYTRALLFLAREDEEGLRGVAAVGPLNANEVEQLWPHVEKRKSEPGAAESFFHWLLDEAQATGQQVRMNLRQDSGLSRVVRGVAVTVPAEQSGIRSAVVRENQDHWLRPYLDSIAQAEDRFAVFACVPLRVEGDLRGILVVDRKYQGNAPAITDEDLPLLELFAEVAALATNPVLTGGQRLAALNEFMTSMQHAVRNRLNIIDGSIQEFRKDLKAEVCRNSVEDVLGLVQTQTRGVFSALDRIRRYASPAPVVLEEPVDLARLIDRVKSQNQAAVKFPINVRPTGEGDGLTPLVVRGDCQSLEDALIELVRNSAEALKDHRGAEDGWIRIALLLEQVQSGHWAVIEVQDNGPGIAASKKGQIFEPFYSGEKGNRWGIGLALARKTITEHAGSIEEVGQEGEGAHFVVRLPMMEGSQPLETTSGSRGWSRSL